MYSKEQIVKLHKIKSAYADRRMYRTVEIIEKEIDAARMADQALYQRALIEFYKGDA